MRTLAWVGAKTLKNIVGNRATCAALHNTKTQITVYAYQDFMKIDPY